MHLLLLNIRISPLLLLRLFGFSFANRILHRGGLRSPSSPNRSSCGRSDGPNSTHWCCQMFRHHFYRVCDLSTISVIPVWISLTPVLSLLLHQSTPPTDSKLLNHKHPSTLSQYAFRVRKPTGIETHLHPIPLKQPITSNDRKIWMLWSFATNCLGLQSVPIALFVRMRSLDDCKVAVRSHKVDFLSGIERRECVELMRVARYFMSGPDIACFPFATSGDFLVKKHQVVF